MSVHEYVAYLRARDEQWWREMSPAQRLDLLAQCCTSCGALLHEGFMLREGAFVPRPRAAPCCGGFRPAVAEERARIEDDDPGDQDPASSVHRVVATLWRRS